MTRFLTANNFELPSLNYVVLTTMRLEGDGSGSIGCRSRVAAVLPRPLRATFMGAMLRVCSIRVITPKSGGETRVHDIVLGGGKENGFGTGEYNGCELKLLGEAGKLCG
jgi:hypothetical protein